MEIVLENSVFSEKTMGEVRDGEIYPYIVVGVDVYRTLECAGEDGVDIDLNRPLIIRDSQGLKGVHDPTMYFSGRHYRIINLENENDYNPQSTIYDSKQRLKELGAIGCSVLDEDILEQVDLNSGYVLTPLYESEMNELKKN